MPTLTILPERFSTVFRMKGLSIKKADCSELCKNEQGFYIDNRFKTDGKTAKIKVTELIVLLKELYENIPFVKIKIKGNYEVTGEYLMEQIINK